MHFLAARLHCNIVLNHDIYKVYFMIRLIACSVVGRISNIVSIEPKHFDKIFTYLSINKTRIIITSYGVCTAFSISYIFQHQHSSRWFMLGTCLQSMVQ